MSRAEIDKSPQEINIEGLAKDVDEEATAGEYQVANIQIIRHEIQKEKRNRRGRAYPSIGEDRTEIFDGGSIGKNFAYHYGGRRELQFNLKIRKYDGVWRIRYGVALRLQPGHREQRKIDMPIRRRVKLFNQYLEEHREEFSGLGMWYSRLVEGEKVPSRIFRPHKIPGQLLGEEITVVLGRREKPSDLSYDDILSLYDELLPVYKYIEKSLKPEDSFDPGSFSQPSDNQNLSIERKYTTTAEQSKTVVEIELEHERIQHALERRMTAEFGQGNVSKEHSLDKDRRVDLVVNAEGETRFYEIKPYESPRECLREAIGQLLEYAYWSNADAPERLIVIGKSELDREGESYLSILKEKFALPLEYQTV